jgi:hypothetical protein
MADWSAGPGAALGGIAMARMAFLLRIDTAATAAAPATSSAMPASIGGIIRFRRFGGSSLLAAVASMAATRGPIVSCIDTLPRAALTAIQPLALLTRGLAQPAAMSARRLAVNAALLVIGRARSARFDACMAIFLARHCSSLAGIVLWTPFLDIADSHSFPR